jgi:HAMP domain-containing protein
MLSRLKIGPKLLLAPGVVLVLLVFLSCGAWYAMVRQNASLEDIVGQRATNMRAATDLVAAAQRGNAEIYQLHTWIGGSFPKSRIAPLIRDIHSQHALTESGLRRLTTMTPGGSAERRYVEQAAAAHTVYVQAVRDVIEIARDDQSISANAMSKAETAFAVVAQRLNALAQLEQTLSQEASNSAAADFRAMAWIMPFVIALAIAVSLGISMAVRRTLLAEIRGIGAAAVDLASGDLTVKDRVYGNDEIAETSRALNASIRNLNLTLRTILESARSIGTASRDLALGNLNLTTRASFRASSLEHTASSMLELAATVNQTADSAQAANRLAESASNVAQHGESVADRLVTTMASVQALTIIGSRRIDVIADCGGAGIGLLVIAAAHTAEQVTVAIHVVRTADRRPVLLLAQRRHREGRHFARIGVLPVVGGHHFGGVRRALQRVVHLVVLAALDLHDLGVDGDHRLDEAVDLDLRLRLGRLDHQRARHREAHGRGVEAEVHQALGHVFVRDAGLVLQRAQVDDALVRDQAVVARVQHRVVRRQAARDVVRVQDRRFGGVRSGLRRPSSRCTSTRSAGSRPSRRPPR